MILPPPFLGLPSKNSAGRTSTISSEFFWTISTISSNNFSIGDRRCTLNTDFCRKKTKLKVRGRTKMLNHTNDISILLRSNTSRVVFANFLSVRLQEINRTCLNDYHFEWSFWSLWGNKFICLNLKTADLRNVLASFYC